MQAARAWVSPDVGDKQAGGSKGIGWDRIAFLLIGTLTLFGRFRSQALLLGSYQDDFFYYLQIAKNIATTGRSTFNGLYLTNGYHPLWMAVMVCLYRVFPGTAFFIALQSISLFAAFVAYLLMKRTLSLYLPPLITRAGAFVFGLQALMLIRYGMEVTLTLPLAMLLIYWLLRDGMPASPWRAVLLGLVASLVVLSRLDAALMVALLCTATLLPRLRQRMPWAVAGAFLCGVLPLLLLYFGLNLHFFHLLTPVSGMSKQMKTGHGLAVETWLTILPTDRMRQLVLLPELLLIAAGLVVMAMRKTRDSLQSLASSKYPLVALLLFPVVHLLLLSFLSDWDIWPWYFYSITIGALAALVLVTVAVPYRFALPLLWMYGGVLTLYAAAYAWHGPNSVDVYKSSLQLARFMDAHPGVYLMGDQAGTTGYLSHQPIVQTEGLVMDKHFLELMRAATPLPQIARDYNADYYAEIGGRYDGTCLQLAEPSNAGLTSPHMQGKVCHEPLIVFYRDVDHAPIRVFRAGWLQ